MGAYAETYVDDAMANLGEAVDYAVYACGMSADEFSRRFVGSHYANDFAAGVPAVLTGLTGTELAMAVIRETGGLPGKAELPPPKDFEKPSEEYWAGSVLAYAQWRTGYSFGDILRYLPMADIVAHYYPYHEASEDKFADIVEETIAAAHPRTHLADIRAAAGLSQSELAERSGVNIRNIQQYEQRSNDINRAQASTLRALARELGCSIESLMER